MCLAIGGEHCIHPDFLERKLNRRQVVEWYAYSRIEPIGAERDDLRSALQTWYLRGPWTDETNTRPEDYRLQMPEPDLTEAEQILSEIRASMK